MHTLMYTHQCVCGTTRLEQEMSIFDQGVAVQVNENMTIMRCSDLEEKRGYKWFITNTHNGRQWASGMAFGTETAAQLRDALNRLLSQ